MNELESIEWCVDDNNEIMMRESECFYDLMYMRKNLMKDISRSRPTGLSFLPRIRVGSQRLQQHLSAHLARRLQQLLIPCLWIAYYRSILPRDLATVPSFSIATGISFAPAAIREH